MGKYSSLVLDGDAEEEGGGKYSGAALSEADAPAPQEAAQEPEMSGIEQSLLGAGLDVAQILQDPMAPVESFGEGLKRFFQGPKQLVLEGLEKVGMVDEGTAEEYTQLTEADRAKFDKDLDSQFKNGNFFVDASQFGGEAFIPSLFPGGQSTALGRVGMSTLSGAATGGASFVNGGESRLQNTGEGAAFGLGIGGLMEMAPAARNKLRQFIAPRLREARGGWAALEQKFPSMKRVMGFEEVSPVDDSYFKRGLEIGNRTGVKFKLSQLDPDPKIEGLEQFVRDSTDGERLARKMEDKQALSIFKYWNRAVRELDPDTTDFPVAVKKAFYDTLGTAEAGKEAGLLGKRAMEAKADFAKADEAIGRIDLTNTLDAIDAVIERLSTPGSGPRAKSIVKEMGSIKDELADGFVSPKAMQSLLENWGGAASGSGRIFSDAVDNASDTKHARDLFKALRKDLDFAADSGVEGSEALKIARDNYAKNSELINVVRKSAVGKFFSKESNLSELTPEGISKRIISMKPSEIKETFEVLRGAMPNIEGATQRAFIENYLEKAKIPGQADVYNFTPAKMLDMVKGEQRDAFKAVFGDGKSRRMVQDGIEATRRIMINNNRTGGRTVARAKELAGVIASQDTTFASRLGAELLAPKLLTRYMVTPEGVDALKVIAKPSSTGPALTAAVTTLYQIAKEGEENGN